MLIGVGSCAIWSVASAAPAPAAESPEARSADVPALIQALSHANPVEREEAHDRLVGIGTAARDAVLDATASDDPEVAARAGQVLLKLPWDRPGDSAEARNQLLRYGQFEERRRARLIPSLASKGEFAVLARLLLEEPSPAVRWQICAQFEELEARGDDRGAEHLRALPLDDRLARSAPALVATGAAWYDADRDRALALFRWALELERSRPSDDRGAMDVAFRALATAAFAADDVEAVAELLRAQVGRHPGRVDQRLWEDLNRDPDPPHPPGGVVARLFALHAYRGPLRGYAHDLTVYGPLLGRPRLADGVGLLMRRLGVPGAATLDRVAYQALPLAPFTRLTTGMFLMAHEQHAAATAELTGALARGPVDPALEYVTRRRLAALAIDREDDAAAASELQRAVALIEGLGGKPDDELVGQLHWRSFRVARARGDERAADEHLAAVLKTPPAHADAAIDIVALLTEQDRQADADAVFDRVYAALRKEVNEEPNRPGPANNLAWLLSRLGRRVDEAVALSTKAIELAPDTPAFLDTAADAQFRAGNVAEAIRLETRALELKPNDPFMREQLDRFRKGRSQADQVKPAGPS